MNLEASFWPNETEIRYAVYASGFGPIGFFFVTWVYGIIDGVVSHQPSLLVSLGSFIYLWLLGIVPSMAITLIVGIPFYVLLKLLGLHNPFIVSASGAPVMWLLTSVNPGFPYREPFVGAAAFVSLVFGAFLWLHYNTRRKCDS